MTLDRRSLMAAGLAAAAISPTVVRAQAPDRALAAAISGPQRTEANKVRDPYRRPAEALTFWGLKPGMTVVEINPGGGGYWTEILAPYLKATNGRYIATGAKPARFADEAVFGKTEWVPLSMTSGPLIPAGTADLVITCRNLHNWIPQAGLLPKFLKDFHAALKPGGLFGVEEHRSDPRPMATLASDGYVSTQFAVEEIQKAGFKLQAKSELNANPKDKKDHPFGVWTLPPTRRNANPGQPTPAGFDRAPFDAIGESDRMTLRFVKT
jgi:predicted methyltransferase